MGIPIIKIKRSLYNRNALPGQTFLYLRGGPSLCDQYSPKLLHWVWFNCICLLELNGTVKNMSSNTLSHTWVRYPGFSGHGVKCPILTTVVPGFSGDLIGCTIRSKLGPFGDLYLARKKLLCVWNKLFLGEIKFSQRRTRPVKSLWWQIVPMQESTNKWKNLTFLNNGTCGNTMTKPQPVRYRLIK